MSNRPKTRKKLTNAINEPEINDRVLRHDEGCKRFTLLVDGGQEAFLDYARVEGDGDDALTLDLYHTEVPETLRGRGIGKVLAKGAFDELLAAHPDARLILSCTYLQHFYASNKGLFAGKEGAFSTATPKTPQ